MSELVRDVLEAEQLPSSLDTRDESAGKKAQGIGAVDAQAPGKQPVAQGTRVPAPPAPAEVVGKDAADKKLRGRRTSDSVDTTTVVPGSESGR